MIKVRKNPAPWFGTYDNDWGGVGRWLVLPRFSLNPTTPVMGCYLL